MSFFDRLGSLFRGGTKASGDPHALRFAVKCGRCGEVVRIRADRRYDLDQDFEGVGDSVVGYVLRKEILGNRCPALMQIEVRYDRGYREQGREATGGEFVELED